MQFSEEADFTAVQDFTLSLKHTFVLTFSSKLGMKLVSISRATGSKKKPESFNLPNTAGIISKIMIKNTVCSSVDGPGFAGRSMIRRTVSGRPDIGFTYP